MVCYYSASMYIQPAMKLFVADDISNCGKTRYCDTCNVEVK